MARGESYWAPCYLARVDLNRKFSDYIIQRRSTHCVCRILSTLTVPAFFSSRATHISRLAEGGGYAGSIDRIEAFTAIHPVRYNCRQSSLRIRHRVADLSVRHILNRLSIRNWANIYNAAAFGPFHSSPSNIPDCPNRPAFEEAKSAYCLNSIAPVQWTWLCTGGWQDQHPSHLQLFLRFYCPHF